MPYFVGITGASGVVLGARLLEELSQRDRVFCCLTETANLIAESEGVSFPEEGVSYLGERDFLSPVASGSFRLKACIVVPCSMGTLGRIASGISGNLIERAADIALKEGWKLVLVPRETPLNCIHLENMLKLARAGAIILPPVLTFYHTPTSIQDMVDFVVGRVLDVLGIEHSLYKRWGS